MTVEALVDKERRIVLPDELLESLQIQPDSRVIVEAGTSYILIQTRPPGLYSKNGILVYDHGRPLPPDHVHWLDRAREERDEQLMGRWTQE